MIPKTIHYCWFGLNPIPIEYLTYIESWRKYFPDYEIKQWNEDNFDLDDCDYIRQAYNEKKWAFVSDYARFKILYENGGVYFDTDVEVIKAMDDILFSGPFMACEKNGVNNDNIWVNPGLGLAAEPHMPLYKEILDFYKTLSFISIDGGLNVHTVVEYVTNILSHHGLENKEGIQCVEKINIYPTDFFCPMNYETGKMNITHNTRTIHHFSMSWKNSYEKCMTKFERFLKNKVGYKIGGHIFRIITFPVRFIYSIKSKGFRRTIRKIIEKTRVS